MLFVLSGNVQIGKTRWLQATIAELECAGVVCHGVLAPGIWVEKEQDGARGFEKLGIRNELLPQHEIIPFAMRADLANAKEHEQTQSGKARLGWAIDDSAISRVNEHLAAMPERACGANKPGLLVIDELGMLELERGQGLTAALDLLERGPVHGIDQALIVVRRSLLEKLEGRFGTWGERVVIDPDQGAREKIFESFGLQ